MTDRSDTGSPPAGPGSPAPAPRRLLRSRRDRMCGGVCGGIAEYFGIDATLVRLGAVALVFMGGAGLVAYALAWAIVPEAPPRPDDPPPRYPALCYVPPVALVLIGLIAFGIMFDGGPDLPWFPLVLLAIGASLVWGNRSAGDAAELPDEAAPAAPTPPPPTEPVLPADWEPFEAFEPIPTSPPQARAPERRHRGRAFVVAVGTVMAAVGVTSFAVAASDVISPRVVVGIALALVGLAIAIGAFSGRSRPVVASGLVLFGALALFSAIDVPFRGGVGETLVTIRDLDDLGRTERLALGRLKIDLTELEVPPDRTGELAASVALGQLTVFVPEDLAVDIDANVGGGEVRINGERVSERHGWSHEVEEELLGSETSGTLVLDLDVGLGEIEVITRDS
ncbi:MAG: PspC domain-containing protein [Acidimicrobiales bacterium]